MENIPDALLKQLNIYWGKLEHDEERLSMPGGVDVNSHEDIFRALMEKVSSFCGIEFTMYVTILDVLNCLSSLFCQ